MDVRRLRRDSLSARLGTALADLGVADGPGEETSVTVADLEELPAVVRRYLHFMGVVDQPRVWSFRARFEGRFRMRPRLGWMPAAAWQYDSGIDIARIAVMRIRVAGLIPMVGRDAYVGGRGSMVGKLGGLITVADGSGPPFDIGELTTWLNDAVLVAPSMLLRPEVRWEEVDAATFEVGLTDAGHDVAARVVLDDRGAPRDFSTTDRFADLPGGPVRAEWRTPVTSWQRVQGRAVPEHVAAVWHLPDGPLPYFEGRFVPGSVDFNVGPAG